MSNLRWAGLGFVFGGAVGVALGWSIHERPAEKPAAAVAKAEAASEAPTAPAPTPESLRSKASSPRVVIPAAAVAPAGETPQQAVARLQKDNDQLRAELTRIRAVLDTTKAVQKAEDGEPIQSPPNLDSRFGQEALLDATQRALKEAGFDKAQVTSVDCTEYPCIVYGDGMGNREDFQQLEKTDALAAYEDDGKSAMGWGTNNDGGGESYRFGFAVYQKPDDQAAKDALAKRIRYRAQQMMSAGN